MARTQTVDTRDPGRDPRTPRWRRGPRTDVFALPRVRSFGWMLRKATRTPREGATARAAGVIAVTLVLAAAAPGAQAQPGFVAIDFTTATTSGNAHAGRTAGTFTSTGRVRDAGRMTTAYRAVGTRVDATAMLMGTRGILTIGLRGALGPVLDGRQSVAGRWRVCGGTGPYLRLAGNGRWQAVTEIGAAPAGMTAPTTRGAFLGRVSRGPGLGRQVAGSAEAPRC